MLRTLKLILFLIVPISLTGMMPERPVYIFKPELPDSIKNVRISFEVKAIKVNREGKVVTICCLNANLLNKNPFPVKLKVNYSCLQKERTEEISIGPNQQKILLIDKQIVQSMPRSDLKSLYSRIKLECPDPPESSPSALITEDRSR